MAFGLYFFWGGVLFLIFVVGVLIVGFNFLGFGFVEGSELTLL